MSGFAARYYDGTSSAARDVHVELGRGGEVHVHGDGVDRRVPRADVRVSSRLGNAPRYLYLPGGARCETVDHSGVDAAFGEKGLLHAIERRWGLVAVTAAIMLAVLWGAFEYALPSLARKVAHAVPPAMEVEMGERSLRALDGGYLEQTRLPDPDRARVQAAFARVAGDLETGPGVRLELRHSETFGPNAFALPSGIVVVTDAMVDLAGDDEALMAVLAHELGHVHHRHIMRSILQSSATALLIATLLGDVTSVTGLAASIPTFLVEQRYSREFEHEADAYALAWMDEARIDRAHLAGVLQRLSEHAGAARDGFERYLSTHPSMQERIDAVRGAPGG